MNKEKFVDFIWERVDQCPKNWRKGQAVFNVIDEEFGVARTIQFKDGIDCFYNDSNIDSFIDMAYFYVSNEYNDISSK